MSTIDFKKFTPYIAAILIFLLIALIYMNPVLSGKKVQQGDISNWKGMSKEIVEFREKTGEEALWTNQMFGGMPAYQISVKYKSNLFQYIDDIFMLGLPRPAGYVFLYFLGFFILMLSLRVNPWLGIAGAIAFAFSSYFFIILEAGHNSKAHAIGYMAPVLAGIILTYRGKYILGALVTGLFLPLEILSGHPQITYYLLMVVIIFGIFELINDIREKRLMHFLKATGLLLVIAVFAGLTHITNLWATYEYGKETIRGPSELTIGEENQTTGLDKDYATDWSYGVAETFTLMIPNAKGGASGHILNSETGREKIDNRVQGLMADAYQKQQINVNSYWGNQPFTSGPVYVGAIVVFLFVLGMFIVKGRLKWVLFTVTILSIMLSWGKNFMPLTDIFLDYIPGYNKFRAVSMTLVIAELSIPILAILALRKIFLNPGIIKEKRKQLYIALGLTGGLSLLFYLFPGFFSFFSRGEVEQLRSSFAVYFSQSGIQPGEVQNLMVTQFPAIISNLEEARIAIFKADAIRSFLYIIIAALVIWLYSLKKIGWQLLVAGIAVLFLADMVTIAYRYLNKSHFVSKRQMEVPYQPSRVNQMIMQDKDPNFRVFNMAANTFNDASTSYFHKSIGGYHGAKLRRYQELISYGIRPEQQAIYTMLRDQPTYEKIDSTLKRTSVLNMLNARYLILDPSQAPFVNKFALGNAWFAPNHEMVENADQEITAIQDFDAARTAIIDQRFAKHIEGYADGYDSSASIKLVNYKPNHLTYTSNSPREQLAVFSEIYYDKGWNAYVDGNKVPYFRVNYVLRGMIVPAGEHSIEFRFEPKVYETGETLSLISSIILLLLIIGGAVYLYRNQNGSTTEAKS